MKMTKWNRLLSLMLCLIMLFINIVSLTVFAADSPMTGRTPGDVERTADPVTMDNYKDFLISEQWGSRYAGRIWSDKSVFSYEDLNGTLTLDEATDGVNGAVNFDEDFLHVFSALGSSQRIEGETPIDLVMVLDVSGSMGNAARSDSKIYHSIEAMNSAIDTLMRLNDNNRVGVVLFASYPRVLMPLAHYEHKLSNNPSALVGNGSYINITASKNYGNPVGASDSNERWWEYTLNAVTENGGTNTIYTGTAGSSGGNGKGGTDHIGSNTNLDSGMWLGLDLLSKAENTTTTVNNQRISYIPSFIVLSDGDPQYMTNANARDWWNPIDVNTNFTLNTANFNNPAVHLTTIMQAAYKKAEVINNYRNNAIEQNAKNLDSVDLGFYSVGIVLGQSGHTYGLQDARAILDPSNYFNSSSTSGSIKTAYNAWECWKAGKKQGNNSSVTVAANGTVSLEAGANDRKFNQIPASGTSDGVTKDQVVENINYSDHLYETDEAENINEILDNLIGRISTPTFVPIEGHNTFGSSNALTYSDPIGKYMEVKNISNVSLFGNLYGVVKSSVYDHNFNVAHTPQGGQFTAGWYDSTGNYKGAGQTDGSFANGDTYYLSDEQAQKYVPSLINAGSHITDKQLNTVYTLYRFNLSETDRQTERTNPCYSGNSDRKYKFDDIRIWTEDIGNYIDDSNLALVGDNDQTLYVEIPEAALPLQTATVILSKDSQHVQSYVTNLNDKSQSTPLRIFYTVGISDDIMTSGGEAVDLTKVSQEYIEKNTGSDNTVYFYSNYYSGDSYSGYGNGVSYTRGDAAMTFAPGSDNRYYIYQKSVPLYASAYEVLSDGSLKEVDTSGGEWQGGNFGGEFDSDTAVREAVSNRSVNIGDIIFLKQDLLSNAENFNSDNYYFIAIEYYKHTTDNNGEYVQYVVNRKGSDFGSGINANEIEENILCWYDTSGNYTKIYPYISNDPNKGRDNITETDGNWVIASKPGGLRVGNLYNSIQQKSSNNTVTSGNSYLPIVDSDATGDGEIIIDSYQGNNGRLAVQNTKMLVTKQVKKALLDNDLSDAEKEKQFNYEVYIQGYSGSYNAIRIDLNRYTGEWQRLVSTIDLLTDNSGFLIKDDIEPVTVNENGEPDVNGNYYVYIGNNFDNATFRLYDYSKNGNAPDRAGFKEKEDGTTDYYVKDVYLVPKSEVDGEGEFNKTYDDIKSGGYACKENFIVATLDSNSFGIASDVRSNYNISTSYLTTQLNFNENNIANFNLKDGEGLLFNGIASGMNYRVTEDLSQNEINSGYDFVSVQHNGDTYNKQSENTDEYYQNQENNHYDYTISGSTKKSIVEEVHFTNSAPSYKKIEVTPGEKELVKVDDEITYAISWRNNEADKADVVIKDKLDPGVDYVNGSSKLAFYDENGNEINNIVYDTVYDTHTITWTLHECPSGSEGKVTFTVKVNEKSFGDWKYNDDNYDETLNDVGNNQDNKVFNRAKVRVGDPDNEWITETVVNPIWVPEKTEVSPGDKVPVEVGDTITYEITWKNYRDENADVLVRDRLDPGVDYTQGSADFIFLNENGVKITDTAAINTLKDGCTATYDASTRTVMWELKNRAIGAQGKVTFKVTVNDKALEDNQKVENQASVKVGNDPWQDTNIVENPVPHEVKEEVDPGEGKLVKTNDIITYRVHWKNDEEQTAVVTIKDPLDIGLDYVDKSADFGGTYDIDSHTITWVLNDQPAGAQGWVSFKATVNSNALIKGEILNQATVQVGENTEVKTNIVQNPTWEPHKTEVDPGNGKLVEVGNDITYNITWKNYKNYPATVVITDPLDNGVNFVSASGNGQYNSSTHTVIWTLESVEPGKEGFVTLTVNVNSNALINNEVENQARVKVGNDPDQYTEIVENPLPGLGNLSIEKTVVNAGSTNITDFTFEVKFTPPNGENLNDVYSYTGSSTVKGVEPPKDGTLKFNKNDDGSYSGFFSLKHGQKITITGIHAGTSYTVTETNRNGYNLRSKTGDKGIIVAGQTMSASFVNASAPVLPEMGGMGIWPFIISGVLMLLVSLPIAYHKVKRKNRSQ